MTTSASSEGTTPPSDPSAQRLGFLGPRGTFTEQAVLTQPDLAQMEHVLCRSHNQVLSRTQAGEFSYGFAAIENAIEGSVNVNQDALAFDMDLLIQREVVIPVEMCLLAPTGVELQAIKSVISYPHALAQVRNFINTQLAEAEVIAANSTADAARLLAAEGDKTTAAVGTALAAEIYGLDILAQGIEDHDKNQTRFVLVGRTGIPAPTGHDKTSIVVNQRADRPGSLVSILQEFAARSINLTKLESRPSRQGLGDYRFLLDLEGHISDEMVADCLRNLHAKQAAVKFLGSYPAASAAASEVRQEATDSWAQAESWLDELRAQVSD